MLALNLRRRSLSVALSALGLFACSSPEGSTPAPPGSGGNANLGGEGGTRGDGDGDGDGDGTPSGGGGSKFTSCVFGADDDKCEGAADIACTPVPISTEQECTQDDNCPAGALCFEQSSGDTSTGICREIQGYCLPRCGGDFDCPDNLHCNRSSGECENTARAGAPFGSSCSPGEDPCAGRCVSIDADHAECEENCRVGAVSGCGESDIEESEIACAFFAYDLSDVDITQGAGDLGVCAKLCNCNDDCPDDQRCLPQVARGYPGVCAGGVAQEDSIECDSSLGGSGPK